MCLEALRVPAITRRPSEMALDGTTPLRCHGWGSRALRDTMMDRAPLGQNWRAQASPASAADAATKVSQIGSGQGWIERREREGCAAADGGVGVWLPGVRWCSRSGDSSVFPASCFSTATPLTPTESVPRLAPPPPKGLPPRHPIMPPSPSLGDVVLGCFPSHASTSPVPSCDQLQAPKSHCYFMPAQEVAG